MQIVYAKMCCEFNCVIFQEFRITMTGLESRRAVLDRKEQKLQSHLAQYDKYIQVKSLKSLCHLGNEKYISIFVGM